jgi:K+-sensing histidine kinase KdpD
LRNPIQNIALANDLLKQMVYFKTDEKYQKVIRRSIQSVMEINKMVANILNLEKHSTNEFETTMAEFHIHSAVEEALSIFERVAIIEEEKVKVQFDLARDLHARNDKQVFQHVLFNLVANAIRFSSSKELVWVSVVQDKNFFKISVKNKGSFIKKEDRELIFDKFFQLEKNTYATMNFGLGLSFCKIAVSCMGGEIWVESDEEKNETTFWFTITL